MTHSPASRLKPARLLRPRSIQSPSTPLVLGSGHGKPTYERRSKVSHSSNLPATKVQPSGPRNSQRLLSNRPPSRKNRILCSLSKTRAECRCQPFAKLPWPAAAGTASCHSETGSQDSPLSVRGRQRCRLSSRWRKVGAHHERSEHVHAQRAVWDEPSELAVPLSAILFWDTPRPWFGYGGLCATPIDASLHQATSCHTTW